MTSFTMNPEPGTAGLGASLGSQTELQKLLINERINCENHKTNYKTLKTKYTRLEDAYSRSQGELKHLLRDGEAEQEKLKLHLAELQRELQDKHAKMEELRRQVMTPQRLELLRVQIQQEMEAPVRERFGVLEEEAERYRCEYNKLRYDFTILTTQLDHQRAEHARVLEEETVLHEAEISRLVNEGKDLAARYQRSDPSREAKRVEALQKEKVQLCVKLKGFEAEAAELRAQKEDLAQQAESVQRSQSRQQAESQAALESAEVENRSVRQQLERLELELRESHEQNGRLEEQLHKAERDGGSLALQIESLEHSHKLEVSNMKLECTRSKGELEREKDALQGQIDGLQVDVEMLQAAAEQHKGVLLEKERELVRKVQSTREEESRKSTALQEEKLALADRLAALERKKASQDAADLAEKAAWEERLHSGQLGEEAARRELQSLRTKLHQCEEAEQRRAELSGLQQQNLELRVQLERHAQSESDFRETLGRVGDELRTARAEEGRYVRLQFLNQPQRGTARVASPHSAPCYSGFRLEERCAKLQQKYCDLKDKLKRAAEAQKKRKTLTENKERKLQNKSELLEAKTEELKLEVALAKKQSSFSEENAKLRRQLKEQQRRLYDFQRLLFGGSDGAGPDFVTASQMPFSLLGSEGPRTGPEQLSLLRQRLKDLERTQRLQLDELGSAMRRDDDPKPDL
ncbi:centrosomal protein of 83 kDa [Brachionichthys hirsutus]|uniref:centrosomal protein of 83 kDa n=1 Tax=Brachionichthys hirsutus TaxID=412623 RepID=UPI00360476C3